MHDAKDNSLFWREKCWSLLNVLPPKIPLNEGEVLRSSQQIASLRKKLLGPALPRHRYESRLPRDCPPPAARRREKNEVECKDAVKIISCFPPDALQLS